MSGPDLIEGYLRELAARLPAPIVDELRDGLLDTYEFHQGRGLSAEEAAGVSVSEFGAPEIVAGAFMAAHPARRVARTLLLTGPVVGGSWACVLIVRRAWDWPVPDVARVGLAVMVLAGVVALAGAAVGTRYRMAGRSAAVGCLVVLAVDVSMLGYVTSTGMLATWPALLAGVLSTSRIAFTASRLPRLLARG